jgi:hypothetical protein
VTFDSVDTTLLFAGLGMDATLIGLLAWRRVYRVLPVFFVFILWSSAIDFATLLMVRTITPAGYLRFYAVMMTLNALIGFAVWVELGRKVLRYNNSTAPGRFFVFLLFALACLPLWLIAKQTPISADHTVLRLVYLHLRQIIGILMVAVLLTIAWMSRILDLRWPERELKVATGLGFSLIIAMTVNILQNHGFAYPIHRRLDQISVAGYLGTMVYWVLSFSQNEAKQQNYSPQV